MNHLKKLTERSERSVRGLRRNTGECTDTDTDEAHVEKVDLITINQFCSLVEKMEIGFVILQKGSMDHHSSF